MAKVPPAVASNISARLGFFGSSQMKNSCVSRVFCVQQLRVGRVGALDVVELHRAAVRLLAQVRRRPAAVRVQHDQDLLRAPHAQLTRGLLRVALQRRRHHRRRLGVRRVARVDDHDPGPRPAVGAVRAAAGVHEPLVDRDRRVHAAALERVVADERERPGCVRRPLREDARPVLIRPDLLRHIAREHEVRAMRRSGPYRYGKRKHGGSTNQPARPGTRHSPSPCCPSMGRS